MACRLTIEQHFHSLPDPRIERSKGHQLVDILIIALCALISGADDFVGIENWDHAKKGWLGDRLGLELAKGIPSHDTFGRGIARLDPVGSRWIPKHFAVALLPGPNRSGRLPGGR